MTLAPPPPPRWVLNLHSPPQARSKAANIPDPPGYVSSSSTGSSKKSKSAQLQQQQQQQQAAARKAPTTEETDTLKIKKAWEIAIAPAKSLPMNAIGMYMSGNSLQIFSIMMVLMLFKTPIQSLARTNMAFARFESEGTKGRLMGVKLVYVLMNLMAIGLGVWKIDKMGLLPTTRSDWLSWESQRMPLERAYPALGS
jgi:hypothetical protein